MSSAVFELSCIIGVLLRGFQVFRNLVLLGIQEVFRVFMGYSWGIQGIHGVFRLSISGYSAGYSGGASLGVTTVDSIITRNLVTAND